MKVLVVDDAPIVRKMNSRVITNLYGQDNVEIFQAGNTLEALGVMEQEESNLVVTDYEMGGKVENNTTDLNGTHLIKTLFERKCSSKIILVSSFGHDDFSKFFSDIDNASFIDNSFTTQDGEVIFDFCKKEGNIADKLQNQVKKTLQEYYDSIISFSDVGAPKDSDSVLNPDDNIESISQKDGISDFRSGAGESRYGAESPSTIVKPQGSFCRTLCNSILSCFSK